MSKLIHLRYRIRAIETIKKITHAMRLIAMSSHSQLKQSQEIMASYRYELDTIVAELSSHADHWQNPILHPQSSHGKVAVIVIGSQKGLCGSFNTHLFKLVTSELEELKNYSIDIIIVGQKILEFFNNHSFGKLRHSYERFSYKKIPEIAHEIIHAIIHAQPLYQSVIIISNEFKNFFIQKPRITKLIPFEHTITQAHSAATTDLLWEQPAITILNDLVPTYLTAQLQAVMIDSLLAEQAARFISMDSATRNADGLLDTTKLEYNKLRQAKITKELTELTGSY